MPRPPTEAGDSRTAPTSNHHASLVNSHHTNKRGDQAAAAKALRATLGIARAGYLSSMTAEG
jgi:hypothetical protein